MQLYEEWIILLRVSRCVHIESNLISYKLLYRFGIGAGIIAPPAGYKLKPGTCVEEFIKDEHSHTEEETAEEEEEAAEEEEEEEEKK